MPYNEDLAYIHDVGFTDFVLNAAPELLARLHRAHLDGGLVVDLGCGSGRWAKVLTDSGYRVLGVDLSPHMIRLARRHAPKAQFKTESVLSVKLPACAAVTAIGEVLNYAFDWRNNLAELRRLFRRVYRALLPGGLFIFDLAGPGQLRGSPARSWLEGKDWALFLDRKEERRMLTRRIVIFRKISGAPAAGRHSGSMYRRSEEIHVLNLYQPRQIAAALRAVGFTLRLTRGYTRSLFRHGLTGFIARKPSGN